MKYYVIAGEASGDLHGSNLIKEIFKLDQNAIIRAWGGDKMQNAGATIIRHFKELSFMGFYEVFMNLKTILNNIEFCKKFSKPYIKTFHVEHDAVNINSDFIDTDAQFLLDTSAAGKEGGTGQKFNWDILSNDTSISGILEKHSFFIAGGLDNNNVRDLILHHKPYGIDVSSGLETSIGKKDHLLMKKFLSSKF